MIKFKHFLEEGVNDPSIFKAIFLAGGPGSGKSFIVGKTSLVSLGFKVVNSDDVFERAMEKAGLEMNPDNVFSIQGQELRDRSKTITGKKMERYLKGRLGLVIDGTGKDYSKISAQKKKLESLGYETAMIFINTDVETSVRRDSLRKRSLGAVEATRMWKEVQKNVGKFQSSFHSNMFILDNNDDSDIERGTISIYRRISSWAKKRPNNSLAMRWINRQKNKS